MRSRKQRAPKLIGSGGLKGYLCPFRSSSVGKRGGRPSRRVPDQQIAQDFGIVESFLRNRLRDAA
ncbi:hypothetical protein CTKZ_21280 [Cellulomonas algicola]|uniref:Uncharacterized protein n=1 Tax=Cellulomonas algicola TaxID=2071633 RepID=A0A401V0Y2_9CELL|nr:hypothetical protein CTKZ_21280 [Cellulomonas algicola]